MFDWLSPFSICFNWLFSQPSSYQKKALETDVKLSFLTFPNTPYTDTPVGMPVSCVIAEPPAASPKVPSSDELRVCPVNPPSSDFIVQNLANLTEIPFEKRISPSGKSIQYVSAPYPKEELKLLTKRFPQLRFSVVPSSTNPSQHRLAIRENLIPKSMRPTP